MRTLLRSLPIGLACLVALQSHTHAQSNPTGESAIWFSKRGGIVEIQQRADALYLELARLGQLPIKSIPFKARPKEHYLIDALIEAKVIFSSYLSPDLQNVFCGLNTNWFEKEAPTICTWDDACRTDVKYPACKTKLSPSLGAVETQILVPNLAFNARQTVATLHKAKDTSLRTFLVENAYGCSGPHLSACIDKVIQQNEWRQYHNKEMRACSASSISLDKCLDKYTGSLEIPTLSLSTTLRISYPDEAKKKQVQEQLFFQDVIFERKGTFDQADSPAAQFAPPSLDLPWPSPGSTYLSQGFSASLMLMDMPVDLEHCGLNSVRSNLKSDPIDVRLAKLAGILRNREFKELCTCRKAKNCPPELLAKSEAHSDALDEHCDDLLYLNSQNNAFSRPPRRLLGHGTHLLGLMAGTSSQDKNSCNGLDTPAYRAAMTPFHSGLTIALEDVSWPLDIEKADAKKVLAKIRALGGETMRDVVNLSLSFNDPAFESRIRSEVCATKTSLFVVQPGYIPANAAPGTSGDVAGSCSSIPGCLSDIPNVLSVVGVAPNQPPGTGYAVPSSHLYGATEKCCSIAAPSEQLLSFFPGDRFAWVSGQSQATAVVSAVAMLVAAQRHGDERKQRLLWPDDIKARLIYTSDPDPSLEGKVVSGYVNPKRATEHIFRHVVSLKPGSRVAVRRDGLGQPIGTVEVEKLDTLIKTGHSGNALVLKDVNVYGSINNPSPEYFAVRSEDAVQPLPSGVAGAPSGYTYTNFKNIKRLLRREGGPYQAFVARPPADFNRTVESQVCAEGNYLDLESERKPTLISKSKWFIAQATMERKVKGMLAGTAYQVEFTVADIDDYVAPIIKGQRLEAALKVYK